MFHFTQISLYTIYLEKQKSFKVRDSGIPIYTKQGLQIVAHMWHEGRKIFQKMFISIVEEII